MKRLGVYITLFGVAAIALPYFDRQLYILSWIDNWGDVISWIIKISLIVVGTVIFFSNKFKGKAVKLDLPENDTNS
ncbi:hypothetical protein [Winogradskyella sp. UBA3174]|uniref:hypothetical protein n=1 Tax=Winogradskyella sp. UBA3174 TaxID=1947785 RepID=UPI0025EFA5C6|nr:hypothetical protein [Winogradskyella sp. UBA3174]|tara:strand:- start:29743 stop:29970 length:228 start_codon:yes stop_codon:yes gene_type:complete